MTIFWATHGDPGLTALNWLAWYGFCFVVGYTAGKLLRQRRDRRRHDQT